MKSLPKSKARFAYGGGSGVADARSGSLIYTGEFSSPKKKKSQEAHSSNKKFGMGDYYGTGTKNPIGRIRDSSNPGFLPVTKKQLGTPPKSVV